MLEILNVSVRKYTSLRFEYINCLHFPIKSGIRKEVYKKLIKSYKIIYKNVYKNTKMKQ